MSITPRGRLIACWVFSGRAPDMPPSGFGVERASVPLLGRFPPLGRGRAGVRRAALARIRTTQQVIKAAEDARERHAGRPIPDDTIQDYF